jgi:hypothetical protein
MATNNAVNTSLSGQTGTGTFVGSTSPTLTTPTIARINDTNANEILALVPVASAVNYVQMGNQATGSYPGFIGAGSDSAVGLVLNVKGASSGASVLIQGVGAANNTTAGYVGEYISSQVLFGSATSISTATPTNLTSISLTAGDWDVWGNVLIVNSGGVMTAAYCGINTTSATLPDFSLVSAINCLAAAGVTQSGLTAPLQRISLNSTTTVYLVSETVFGTGTSSQSGFIGARRRR